MYELLRNPDSFYRVLALALNNALAVEKLLAGAAAGSAGMAAQAPESDGLALHYSGNAT